MKLILITSVSAYSSDFPIRIELGKNARIRVPEFEEAYTVSYARFKDELVISIVDLRGGFRKKSGKMTLLHGWQKSPGLWEGVLVSTRIKQDPAFLPGTWTAREAMD